MGEPVYMIKKIHMGPAKCALDLGDGSERGEYVNQDYILNVLGCPHRAVNIMYTYYPKDKQWPQRISEACADMEVNFAWDYPYDDYPPFIPDGAQFEQMRDIRRHGQDVMLTLTIDCSLDDNELINIARQLSTFGRMMLRINHECNGNWFTHNRRFSYEEIGKFFVRFCNIIKEHAPNVRVVFCAGLVAEDGKVEHEDVFADAYRAADIWSADKYIALHYGWPYDKAEAGGGRYESQPVSKVFETFDRTYKRLCSQFGNKPFIQAESNADGDVTGPMQQGGIVSSYYNMVRDENARWLSGISMYQFRDRGRLGLEIQDPNNASVGIAQPLLKEYKRIMQYPYFSPEITVQGETSYPATLRWGGSEDADGIEIVTEFEHTPEFCEVTLQEDLSLMLEFNGRWFYKGAGVCEIDLMPAFFERPLTARTNVPLRIFATPPDGENHKTGRDDWNTSQYYEMTQEVQFRIRYETTYGE